MKLLFNLNKSKQTNKQNRTILFFLKMYAIIFNSNTQAITATIYSKLVLFINVRRM